MWKLPLGSLLVLALSTFSVHAEKCPFNQLVVVLDPGHGGKDPGAHGNFQGADVYEAPYVLDVALRVARLVDAGCGIALLTRHDPKRAVPSDVAPNKILPFEGNGDLYTVGGQGVHAHVSGMLPRLALAKQAVEEHPHNLLVFVSLH